MAAELVTFDKRRDGISVFSVRAFKSGIDCYEEVGGDSSRHEAVTEEPDEIVEAAIERVYKN